VIVWLHLRSPERAHEFERLMAGDRDSEQVQRLADDYAHFVSAREMLVLERVL
jgi:hypothetical protein